MQHCRQCALRVATAYGMAKRNVNGAGGAAGKAVARARPVRLGWMGVDDACDDNGGGHVGEDNGDSGLGYGDAVRRGPEESMKVSTVRHEDRGHCLPALLLL